MTSRHPDGPDLYESLGTLLRSATARSQNGSRETANVETVDEEDTSRLIASLEL